MWGVLICQGKVERFAGCMRNIMLPSQKRPSSPSFFANFNYINFVCINLMF
jgi:hypothetical protein